MILVFIEHVDGKINKASYEAVRAAPLISGETGQAVSAVIFGNGVGASSGEIASKKLGAVYTVENDHLKTYTADAYSAAFKQVI
jgi:electron transfer flavoprotein alpha subunit